MHVDPHWIIPLVVTFEVAAAFWFYRKEIQDEITRFNGRGPRPPSHPLPVETDLTRPKRSRGRRNRQNEFTLWQKFVKNL